MTKTTWWMGLLPLLLSGAASAAAPTSAWIVDVYPQVSVDQLPPWDAAVSTRAQRREQIADALESLIQPTQRRLEDVIRSQEWVQDAKNHGIHICVDRLWMQNTLIVRVDASVDAKISTNNHWRSRADTFFSTELPWLPGVASVERDTQATLWSPHHVIQVEGTENTVNGSEPQSNIRLLHAPELWEQAKLQGQGVTVASIDSGVRYTHETLVKTFRGYTPSTKSVTFDYAFWFPSGTDVSKETPDTVDPVGHGTHTMGTAVGSLGIGVAPGATWIAARAFDIQGAVKKSDFLQVMQWMLCPTKVDGSAKNCSLGADVITGSFGVDRSDTETFKQWTWITHTLQVWQAAGSFAVFASGNTNGFKCGSVYYPASRPETVAVGALIGGSTLWGASGKGPGADDDMSVDAVIIKPDFVVPGAAIRSALSVGDNKYTRMTGSSMATPHVAGLLALMLSGLRDHRSSSGLIPALQQTAGHKLSKPFLVPSACGGTKYDQFPNNIYGFGLPNVCDAARAALKVQCTSTAGDLMIPSTNDQLTSVE